MLGQIFANTLNKIKRWRKKQLSIILILHDANVKEEINEN